MSKQAFKRVRRALKMQVNRKPLDAFAWPGGYPLLYVFADGGVCCPECANANIDEIDANMRGERRFNSHGGWALGAVEPHYEEADGPTHCDHCGRHIESAYGSV